MMTLNYSIFNPSKRIKFLAQFYRKILHEINISDLWPKITQREYTQPTRKVGQPSSTLKFKTII